MNIQTRSVHSVCSPFDQGAAEGRAMMMPKSSAGSAGGAKGLNGRTHQPAMRRSQSSSLYDRTRVDPREKQRPMDSKMQLQEWDGPQQRSAMDSELQLHIARHKVKLRLEEWQGFSSSRDSKQMDPKLQLQEWEGPQQGPGMDSHLQLKISRHKLQHELQLQERRGPAMDSNLQHKFAHRKIALLTAELKRCRVENEAVRASFLSHVEASRRKNKANEEAMERLQLENEALRGLLRESFTAVSGPERAAFLEYSTVSTISDLTLDEIIQGDVNTKTKAKASESLRPTSEPMRPERTVKFIERMRTSSLHSIPGPRPDRVGELNPFDDESVADDEDTVESVDGETGAKKDETKKSLTEMPGRSRSVGLLVGFGRNETGRNGVANVSSRMKTNHRQSPADESGGSPANPSQNSAWGLMRPNQPPSSAESQGGVLSNFLRSSFSRLARLNQQRPSANESLGERSDGSSQSKNAAWGLIRHDQGALRNKNPQDQPTDLTLDSTHSMFATSETFEQDIKFGDASGMDPDQDIDFDAIVNCSVIRDFLEFADIGDDGPENSEKPFVKAPVARCQSEGVGFGAATRRPSSPNKPNLPGDTPVNSGETARNATWYLIRPNRRATTSSEMPGNLPHPLKNAAWGLTRPTGINGSEATRCNSEAPRMSHVSEESNSSVPTRCSSEGLLVGFGGTEIRRNSAAKLLSSLQKSKDQSYTGKIAEDMPDSPPQNSTWGLLRPNKQTSLDERPRDPLASSSQNSTWGLTRPSKNETLDSIQAKSLQSKLNREEGIKFGTAGDDWSAPDEDAEEQRIRRVVSERSLRRKANAAARKGSENASNEGHARGNSANVQSEAQKAKCMNKESSPVGLDQHQHQIHLAKKTRGDLPIISLKPTTTQDEIPGMMRVNSLASIPEKPRARFSHRQGRRRGEQQQRATAL